MSRPVSKRLGGSCYVVRSLERSQDLEEIGSQRSGGLIVQDDISGSAASREDDVEVPPMVGEGDVIPLEGIREAGVREEGTAESEGLAWGGDLGEDVRIPVTVDHLMRAVRRGDQDKIVRVEADVEGELVGSEHDEGGHRGGGPSAGGPPRPAQEQPDRPDGSDEEDQQGQRVQDAEHGMVLLFGFLERDGRGERRKQAPTAKCVGSPFFYVEIYFRPPRREPPRLSM